MSLRNTGGVGMAIIGSQGQEGTSPRGQNSILDVRVPGSNV